MESFHKTRLLTFHFIVSDGIYLTKFEELQKYVPFLNGMIRKLEASKDKVRDAQLKKMKNLLGILTDKERRYGIASFALSY